ncbi:Mitogen-activated protein kinase kinase kinase kinase 3, partial [Nowakowskiella sp. JEL0078]
MPFSENEAISNQTNSSSGSNGSANLLINNREFQMLEHIGTGSYGEVFKARMHANGQLAAVKVIKLEAGEELDEVLNEVNFLRECDHMNIVKYCGCYMKKGPMKGQKQVWIAMEYCGGGSAEAIYK